MLADVRCDVAKYPLQGSGVYEKSLCSRKRKGVIDNPIHYVYCMQNHTYTVKYAANPVGHIHSS